MKIHLYSPVHFEKWDWRNSINEGIGGSETAATELAYRFAARGHEVVSYSPLRDDSQREWRGTTWKDLTEADFSEPGLWIIFRSVKTLDEFEQRHDQRVWLFLQDENPGGEVSKSQVAKIERVIALCQWHKAHLETHWPEFKGKIVVSSNGLKGELIDEVEAQPIVRNPKRLIYASSPDRGLRPLLKIFRRAKEFVPDIELHIFYGDDNMRKMAGFDKKFRFMLDVADKMREEANQPGVTWHGRVSQRQLYREMLMSGIWCYPNSYGETSCIQCMEQQALGAIPITRPYWALSENVQHGVFIQGDPNDPLVQAHYVESLVYMATRPDVQEKIRTKMMPWARAKFDWRGVVEQLDGLISDDPKNRAWNHHAYQRGHAHGRVMSLGCGSDFAGLKKFGSFNVDINARDPIDGKQNVVDLLADARDLPDGLPLFDTVIIGEMLEHMGADDRRAVLMQAKKVLADGGRVVITFPEDRRPPEKQFADGCNAGAYKRLEYAEGIPAWHESVLTLKDMQADLEACGFGAVSVDKIDYIYMTGYGIVCEPINEENEYASDICAENSVAH